MAVSPRQLTTQRCPGVPDATLMTVSQEMYHWLTATTPYGSTHFATPLKTPAIHGRLKHQDQLGLTCPDDH